ncbi:hypothetical protein PGTUg99_014654 [Puccinia graminis f. sp. tritici]|uniref:Uncharacterized protein n=2 Tax=Puccinia graminis f. sp. tritici TaxID=56615 RepID=A0A5B0RLC8_PUCGR|nr:hypothetical protein PGTUg99_014654 [Puccinia graminis f. sp. tritici]
MGNTRKRHKDRASSTTSISSSPAQLKGPSRKKRNNAVVDTDGDSEVEQQDTDVDHTTSASTQNLEKDQDQLDAEELKKAMKVHKNQQSACYASYNPPQLSDQLDKNGRRMIAYPCKTCGSKIHQPIYDTSPSNLSKHVASCLKREQESQHNLKLAALGVTGTGDIEPREVPQLCAIWCAQAARPFSALGEQAHRGIMHPIVVKNLPP